MSFQEVYHPESTYLEKPPTAQLTRIDAADRLFSVSLTRITSVPECAVSSVGFPWGSAAVSLSCGVSVGLADTEAPDWAGRPGTGTQVPPTSGSYDHFLVTQCHQGDLAGGSNSAPIAESARLAGQLVGRRVSSHFCYFYASSVQSGADWKCVRWRDSLSTSCFALSWPGPGCGLRAVSGRFWGPRRG